MCTEKATDVEIDTTVPEGMLSNPKPKPAKEVKESKKEAVSEGESEEEFDWNALNGSEDEEPKKGKKEPEEEPEELGMGELSGSEDEKSKKSAFDEEEGDVIEDDEDLPPIPKKGKKLPPKPGKQPARKAAKATPQDDAPKKGKGKSGKSKHPGRNEAEDI